jgi:hypothetical protein
VVTAARQALAAADVDLVLPYVSDEGEDEIRDAFARVLPLLGREAAVEALAQRWFFETVVRVHRTGEHAAYTGLKPAGLNVGPVIPVAERAIATGDVDEVTQLLATDLRRQLTRRLERVTLLAADRHESVAAARAYVHAMLDFQVYSNHVFHALHTDPHGAHSHP